MEQAQGWDGRRREAQLERENLLWNSEKHKREKSSKIQNSESLRRGTNGIMTSDSTGEM